MAIIKSPTQIREEQARSLVALLNNIKSNVDEDKVNLKNVLLQLNGVLERFYGPQDTQLATADKLKKNILTLERKKCNSTSDPRCNVHDIAEDTKSLCDSVIIEVNTLGIPFWKSDTEKSVNVNTTVTQSQEQKQNQHQDVIVKILIEAAKDELTGKQWKELLAVAQAAKSPEEAHNGILEKFKSFGADVSASIVANILTNPQVWSLIDTIV